jgi:drug/metabolite transporter superfamily protein YnfA
VSARLIFKKDKITMKLLMNNVFPWSIFMVSALLEVGGDALIRKGLRGSGVLFIVSGFLVLGCYGLVVNIVKWDFARLLGVYVAVFAITSLLFSRFLFKEQISFATWIGLSGIVLGGLIIQFGQ